MCIHGGGTCFSLESRQSLACPAFDLDRFRDGLKVGIASLAQRRDQRILAKPGIDWDDAKALALEKRRDAQAVACGIMGASDDRDRRRARQDGAYHLVGRIAELHPVRMPSANRAADPPPWEAGV